MDRSEYLREWRRKNLEKKKAYRRAYRARKKGAGLSHTAAEWEAVKQAYNYTCLRCGRSEPDIKLTPDHVRPVSRGGSDAISNIQPLCMGCNGWKNARTIDYRVEGSAEQEHLALLLGSAAHWSPEARARAAERKRQDWAARGHTANSNNATAHMRGIDRLTDPRYTLRPWRARATINGQRVTIGLYASEEEAVHARLSYLQTH